MFFFNSKIMNDQSMTIFIDSFIIDHLILFRVLEELKPIVNRGQQGKPWTVHQYITDRLVDKIITDYCSV